MINHKKQKVDQIINHITEEKYLREFLGKNNIVQIDGIYGLQHYQCEGNRCGFIVDAENGKVVNIEGDPDHPINRGAACAKGASMRQLSADNPWRLSKVLYRAPGAADWEEKSWDWALDQIARKIKDTRDANFIERESGKLVNRTEAMPLDPL